MNTALNAHFVLLVGTTGKVDPARQMPLLAAAKNKAKVVEVNPNLTLLSRHASLLIRDTSSKVLRKIADECKRIEAERAKFLLALPSAATQTATSSTEGPL